MRKILVSAILSALLSACAPKEGQIEKRTEDGAEIVINRLQPYSIKGENTNFRLEDELVIDTGDPIFAGKGVTRIYNFDINSRSEIFILCLDNKDSLVFRFDNRGTLIHSFGRRGQGPGEIQDCDCFRINAKDELVISTSRKILFFSADGEFLKEFPLPIGASSGTALDNGHFLLKDAPRPLDKASGKMVSALCLYDPQFRKIKELESVEYPDPGAQEIKAVYHKLLWHADSLRIVTAAQGDVYEIRVYDLQGNLVRKLVKAFDPVSPTDEYKESYRKNLGPRMSEMLKDRISFPASLPPFHAFFADEEGRIFVMTYEEGLRPDEAIYDILNGEGIFVGRQSLKKCLANDNLQFSAMDYVLARMKNGRLYYLRESEEGEHQLIVSRVTWESGIK
jgi:hypothetical protein